MKYLLLVVMGIFLFGCSVEKQTNKKVSWLLGHNQMALKCAELYPNKDSIGKEESFFVAAEDTSYQRILDSVSRVVDSLNNSCALVLDSATSSVAGAYVENISKANKLIAGLRAIIIRLRSQKPPPDTVYKQVPHYITNTAEVTNLKIQLDSKDKVIAGKDQQITTLQAKVLTEDKWKLYFFILLSLVALGLVIKIFVLK